MTWIRLRPSSSPSPRKLFDRAVRCEGAARSASIGGPHTEVGTVPVKLEPEIIERGEERLQASFALPQRFGGLAGTR